MNFENIMLSDISQTQNIVDIPTASEFLNWLKWSFLCNLYFTTVMEGRKLIWKTMENIEVFFLQYNGQCFVAYWSPFNTFLSHFPLGGG